MNLKSIGMGKLACAIGFSLFAGLPFASIAEANQCKRQGVIQLAPGYNWANIYRSASTGSQVLGRLSNGSKVCVHGTAGNFLKIQSGKTVGFIVRR